MKANVNKVVITNKKRDTAQGIIINIQIFFQVNDPPRYPLVVYVGFMNQLQTRNSNYCITPQILFYLLIIPIK